MQRNSLEIGEQMILGAERYLEGGIQMWFESGSDAYVAFRAPAGPFTSSFVRHSSRDGHVTALRLLPAFN